MQLSDGVFIVPDRAGSDFDFSNGDTLIIPQISHAVASFDFRWILASRLDLPLLNHATFLKFISLSFVLFRPHSPINYTDLYISNLPSPIFSPSPTNDSDISSAHFYRREMDLTE